MAAKAGSLIIVGTGIESIGQITLQAIAYIEAADKVFYCVVDPPTEAFLLNKNKNSVDLYQYYENGKSRMDTYIQMAEVDIFFKDSERSLRINDFRSSCSGKYVLASTL